MQWLTNNPIPSSIAQFEKVYGKGSSMQFLKPSRDQAVGRDATAQ
jgi:hypothetical protein